jgi:hypothetical protein
MLVQTHRTLAVLVEQLLTRRFSLNSSILSCDSALYKVLAHDAILECDAPAKVKIIQPEVERRQRCPRHSGISQ